MVTPLKETFTCRTLTGYTLENLDFELKSLDWSSFDNMVDVDQGWQHLHDNFIKALDKVAPIIIMNNVKQR